MGTLFNRGMGFKSDRGLIYPTQMMNYNEPLTDEQTGNVGQMGTNIIAPFLSNPSLTTYEYTLVNGHKIHIDKAFEGDGVRFHYNISMVPGFTQSGLAGTYVDNISIVMFPYSEDLNDVEKWNLLVHYTAADVYPGYHYDFRDNESPNLTPFFNGSQGEEPEDNTLPEGGRGDIDIFSDDVPFPSLPTINYLDTNMIRLYSPTTAEIQGLANYLWSGSFFTNINKIMSDPMQSIISINILPVTPTGTAGQDIIIGNTNSGVQALQVSAQHYYIDFGKIDMGEYQGTYYDYAPFTRADIYLPFIGVRQIDVNEIIGSELWLQYMVDVLSGSFTAMLHVKRKNKKNNSEELNGILYHWNGSMAIPGAITAKDYTEQLKTHIGTVATLGIGAASVIATGGASTPVLVGAGASALGASVKEVTTQTPVEHSGNITGNSGMLGVQFPYVIMCRPNVTAPSSIAHDEGLQSLITGTIGNMRGFIKMQNVHVEGVTCTNKEKDEIERILKEGIIY